MREAMYYKKLENDSIKCELCPHECEIVVGGIGRCRGRKNIDGVLYAINYGEIAAIQIDPIEKKPLNHFHAGMRILSVGTFGCNLKCKYCQNHHLAHANPNTQYMDPEELVFIALKDAYDDNLGIAFTYNEPNIWYEYILDTAKELKKQDPGKKVVLITNGFINEKPLKELLPYVDAMNIDLKSFSGEFYVGLCSGKKDPVLKTIKLAAKKCHVEITTLVVTELNDSEDEMDMISSFISGIDRKIPLHISRYFPAYELSLPATDVETLEKLRVVALNHLDNVYLGNV